MLLSEKQILPNQIIKQLLLVLYITLEKKACQF